MNNCRRQVTLAVFLIMVAVLFSSCVGTGSSSSNPPAGSTLVSGVVVDNGPALTNATVVINDSLGAQKTTTTATDGSYSIDVSSLTAPFVLTATGNVGSTAVTLWSVEDVVTASTTNTVNITPWTTAIAAALSSTGKAQDLNAMANKQTILSDLTQVDAYTKTLLAPTLVEAGYTATQGPIETAFTANGTGYDSIYANLAVGTTATNAVFMADLTATPCGTGETTNCVAYSDPGTQTVTDPNICGSDIASGAPILCDSNLAPTAAPPSWPQITMSQAYTFGCVGCIFWGNADNFSQTPTQTPLTLTGITPTSGGSGGGGGGGGGGGTGGPYYWDNWTCGSSSQCASLMGGYTGSTGPMCTLSDCTAWGNKFIPGGYSCSTTPIYTESTGTPANGVCAQNGVDFRQKLKKSARTLD
jgi:hypothetical protein